jgi:hypothetical protein
MAGALEALRLQLLPLRAFSIAFNDVQLEGTNKLVVPYFPLEAAASTNFNQANGYVFGDTYSQGEREVTIDKRKYQPLSIASSTFARQPNLDAEAIGKQKGIKLAEDVMTDILSAITIANFGAAVFTGAASTLDFAAVNETIGGACDVANWPNLGRALILKSAYYRNIVTDLGDVSKYGSDDPVKRGVLQNVAGFEDIYNNQSIPANAENLVGFACMPSAMLVGFSPIAPKDGGRIIEYETMSDEDTGLTVEYRRWFDADMDLEKTVLEVNYGYAKGEEAALKRIQSAAL